MSTDIHKAAEWGANVCPVSDQLPTPYYDEDGITIYHGDCREILPKLSGYDSVVTDPPYAEINRDYGRLTEPEWHELMRAIISSVRSNLAPNGSAVFILQPNSERLGRMRPWLWEFMAWAAREWNQIQDAWWWNSTALPNTGCNRNVGLMRPSVKACVWLGDPDCYRDQSVVLLPISDSLKNDRRGNELRYYPSGYSVRKERMRNTALERGGTTPFNLLMIPNTDSLHSAGANGHGARTPRKLADWWIRYITPDKGTVVDPFCGSGTMLAAAQRQGLKAIGIEIEEKYCEIAVKRLAQKVLW